VGGSVERCREAFYSILSGVSSPAASVVALNAAVALQAVQDGARLEDEFERAAAILRSGAAMRTFERAKELAPHG
jgi:anthranilate phosphoribosyltransferase